MLQAKNHDTVIKLKRFNFKIQKIVNCKIILFQLQKLIPPKRLEVGAKKKRDCNNKITENNQRIVNLKLILIFCCS